MAKLIVDLPEELHEELKKTAALSRRTIKNVVTDLAEEYVSRGAKGEGINETGLCGRWEDTRTPEAIIADIKAHRNWLKRGIGNEQHGSLRPNFETADGELEVITLRMFIPL